MSKVTERTVIERQLDLGEDVFVCVSHNPESGLMFMDSNATDKATKWMLTEGLGRIEKRMVEAALAPTSEPAVDTQSSDAGEAPAPWRTTDAKDIQAPCEVIMSYFPRQIHRIRTVDDGVYLYDDHDDHRFTLWDGALVTWRPL